MLKPAPFEQLEILRAQLETVLPAPCILLLSSARSDDGKGLVAAGLARCMAAAGYSTLLVHADERKPDVDPTLEQPASLKELCDLGVGRFSSRTSPGVMALPSRKISHTVSRDDVSRFGETCRNAYQITIVEAASLLTNSFAMLAAFNADAVLLTIREGRRVCAIDRQLAKTLAREKVPFLGVVSVEAAIIRGGSLEPVPKELGRSTLPALGNHAAGRQEEAV
jgi:Mrp family chromosome partitioning ATPase